MPPRCFRSCPGSATWQASVRRQDTRSENATARSAPTGSASASATRTATCTGVRPCRPELRRREDGLGRQRRRRQRHERRGGIMLRAPCGIMGRCQAAGEEAACVAAWIKCGQVCGKPVMFLSHALATPLNIHGACHADTAIYSRPEIGPLLAGMRAATDDG